jgi:N-carbamoylputrescine amidase
MIVTACEMHDGPEEFAADWERLVVHVREHASELVVLPEMPFHPWFATSRHFDPEIWAAAVAAHDAWEARLDELAPALVIATRPVDFGNERYNAGFVWSAEEGLRTVHTKAYLPDEPGVWEASWYHKETPDFVPAHIRNVALGFLICTEIWAMEQARAYGLENVNVLVTPRLTSDETLDKWLAAGRVASVLAGAFGISSNRCDGRNRFGGQGWIVGPDGEVLALTSRESPFVSVEIDLEAATRAKTTYPRYALGPPVLAPRK